MSDDKLKDIKIDILPCYFLKIKVACNYIPILPYHATVRLEKKVCSTSHLRLKVIRAIVIFFL